jgi:hypothetical protein
MLLAITIKRITLAALDRWEIDYNSKMLVSRIVSGMIWLFAYHQPNRSMITNPELTA